MSDPITNTMYGIKLMNVISSLLNRTHQHLESGPLAIIQILQPHRTWHRRVQMVTFREDTVIISDVCALEIDTDPIPA
jgi:hypothetical protein